MSVDFAKEKLLCIMVLDDAIAKRLSVAAGEAFWRGFILEDRESHAVHALHRFSYEDGNKNWFELKPKTKSSIEDMRIELETGMEYTLLRAMELLNVPIEEVKNPIMRFYPPDDKGEPMRTILWLEEQDLITVNVVDKEGWDKKNEP